MTVWLLKAYPLGSIGYELLRRADILPRYGREISLTAGTLVVGVGGAASPIEITMRDETAEISGSVSESLSRHQEFMEQSLTLQGGPLQ